MRNERWIMAEDEALKLVQLGFKNAKKTKGTGSVNRDMDISAEGLHIEVKSRKENDIYLTSLDLKETLSKVKRKKCIWFFVYMNLKCELYLIVLDRIYYMLSSISNINFETMDTVVCKKSIKINYDMLRNAAELHKKICCNTKYASFYALTEMDAIDFLSGLSKQTMV